jgi:hypothetical protein
MLNKGDRVTVRSRVFDGPVRYLKPSQLDKYFIFTLTEEAPMFYIHLFCLVASNSIKVKANSLY